MQFEVQKVVFEVSHRSGRGAFYHPDSGHILHHTTLQSCNDKAVSPCEANTTKARGWLQDVSPEDISHFINAIFPLMREQWSQWRTSEDTRRQITKSSVVVSLHTRIIWLRSDDSVSISSVTPTHIDIYLFAFTCLWKLERSLILPLKKQQVVFHQRCGRGPMNLKFHWPAWHNR